MTIAIYLIGLPGRRAKQLCAEAGNRADYGLVAHQLQKIGESRGQKYIFKWSILASMCAAWRLM